MKRIDEVGINNKGAVISYLILSINHFVNFFKKLVYK